MQRFLQFSGSRYVVSCLLIMCIVVIGWLAYPLLSEEGDGKGGRDGQTDKPAPTRKELQTLLNEQLNELYETKDEEVAEKVPRLLDTVKLIIKKTDGDVPQFQITNMAAILLEHKHQYEAVMKLRLELKEHFAKAENKLLAELADAAYESVVTRIGFLGKSLQLEGTLVGGGKFNWKKYQGKVVLIDFWATWCGPCLKEIPNYLAQYEKYHDQGFEVVGISLDEYAEDVSGFLEQNKIPWETLLSDDLSKRGYDHPLAVKFGLSSIPFTLLLNREGKVVELHLHGDTLGKHLKKLLAKNQTGD